MEQQVLHGIRQGNAVLAELQKEVSLEEVEKLMADTAEAVAYQNVLPPSSVVRAVAANAIPIRKSPPCWLES